MLRCKMKYSRSHALTPLATSDTVSVANVCNRDLPPRRRPTRNAPMTAHPARAPGPTQALPASQLAALASIVGDAHVHSRWPDRYAYARDRLPFATFVVRAGHLPGTLPSAVICPGTHDEVAEVVRWARRAGVALVPFGAGSGVLGGAIPLGGEAILDLKRLNRMVRIDTVNGLASVGAGMNGGQFESALADHGYTCGHLPQSLHMSTVGGWAACRGAGQTSSRYGKIEDIVRGLKVVLPDGETLDVRPVARRATGPDLLQLFIGSEGVLGAITEVTLRVWKRPEREHGVVVALPGVAAGFAGLREIMQDELRPAVTRLYDETETRARTAGMPAFASRPVMLMLVFSGPERLARVEEELALEILARHGGVVADEAPYREWTEHRYLSYSPKWQSTGHYMDTIEVTGPWSELPAMHQRSREAALAVHPHIHFGTHWSHVYPDGACQYMTFRLPPLPDAEALVLHARVWDAIESITLDCGGSISHHHGSGAFRNRWMRGELGSGLDVLQAIKDALDPANLMNPGKLGLRAGVGARGLGGPGEAGR